MMECLFAQEIKSFNINLKNENMETIKTGFSLSIHIEKIIKIDEVNDPVTMKAIKATQEILASMHKGDIRRLTELSYSQKEIDFFNGILPIYQNMYKNDEAEIIAQIKLENKRFIFYKTFMKNDSQKKTIYLFSLLMEKNNNFVFVFPNEVETIIAEITCGSLNNGLNKENYAIQKSETLQKIMIHQDRISGNDCYLVFTGIPVQDVDVSAYNEQHQHNNNIVHDILIFLKSSLNDIRSKSSEEYADLYYTKKSAKTFVNSLSRMQKEGLEMYLNRICNGGYVVHYIIDASPYYVIFYKQKGNQLEPSEKKTKKYNYVFCLKENQKLKFTNYLRSNTFFDSLINKRIIDIDQFLDQEKITKQ